MDVQRRHFKSRTGCLQCKQRKIKCDEAKPSCRNCERHKSTCSYLKYIPLASRPQQHHPTQQLLTAIRTARRLPARSLSHNPTPTNALSSLPLQFTILELELLHFYTTTTSHEILGHHMTGTHLWRTSIITLSFHHSFLLHELLSLSALHLVYLHTHSTSPELRQKYIQAATYHHLQCVSSFRLEIQDLTPENSDACCACAPLLGLHAWAVPGGQGANLFFSSEVEGAGVEWYKLHRGGNEVLKSAFQWVEKGPLGDMIRPWLTINLHSTTISHLQKVEDKKLDTIATCWIEAALNIDDKAALDETLRTLRYVFSLVSSTGIGISTSIATLSWTTLIPRRFCEMIEEGCPQALILVTVYCVLLKRVEEFWWIRGKAESLLAAARRELVSEEWDQWVEWPVGEIEGKTVH